MGLVGSRCSDNKQLSSKWQTKMLICRRAAGKLLEGTGAPFWLVCARSGSCPESTSGNACNLQAETLVGVMSDKALDALINSKGKFNMSSNW